MKNSANYELPTANCQLPSDTPVSLGLIAHTQKLGAASVVKTIVTELRARSLPFLMEQATAALIQENSSLSEEMLAEKVDLLLVMGGDGSILRALHHVGPHLRPIFGLNIGSLGFLTCLPAKEYQRAIECIINGEYILSHRSLLELKISGFSCGLALNDIVISRGERSQLIRLSVNIDGIPLTKYHADGLVIATPTGSTAYSLAAGGPIMMPESKTILITPICPHVFSNRSIVIDDKSNITIEAPGDQQVFISLDGREPRVMQSHEQLTITTSEKKLPLAMLPHTSFPEILGQKLKWTGSNF
jgi:NAD+ kinase